MSKMSVMSFSFSLNVNAIYVEDVEDRSNTPKGCNAMYVEDVEDGKGTYTHIFAHNFLNIQLIFNPQKVLCVEVCQRCQRSNNLQHLRHSSTYIGVDGMVRKP